MRPRQFTFNARHISVLALALLAATGLGTSTGAQSQEPKPLVPATPVSEPDLSSLDSPPSGVTGSSWEGPNSGVRVSWDPAIWTVEGEFSDVGYDGLQIGTPLSTVYVEAYAGFDGNATTCFTEAEREIGEREGVSEVIQISGRPLPVAEDERGIAGYFGVTATLSDGTIYRGVEYIECRTAVPGESVLEITWQAATRAFNEDFPHVETLLRSIEMPDEARAATPVTPAATPVN